MRQVTTICDRCSSVCLNGHSVLRLEHGELSRRHDEALDLCEGCSDRFGNFMHEGRKAVRNGVAAIPVASDVLPVETCYDRG